MASFEPFVSSDPFSMSTFNTKLGGAFGKVDKNVSDAQTVANNALQAAQAAGLTMKQVWANPGSFETGAVTWNRDSKAKFLIVTFATGSLGATETMGVVVPINTSGSGSITKTHTTYNGHIILVCKPYTLTADGITFNTAYRAELANGQTATVDASESNIFIMKIYEVS